ncbi:hypothetical protein OIDMADRAFT_21468 [Oidiodendron maius Zn]|uniref:Uncharacterized protein n=1 Tax=Oidiodendron maius (strain Zn) TaxID=913774 RepID=A0A0C3GRF4_OIDMZ|nr:hypothetical protein OIDMADRAFT_21468 [Oidiodendron maius Zn]
MLVTQNAKAYTALASTAGELSWPEDTRRVSPSLGLKLQSFLTAHTKPSILQTLIGKNPVSVPKFLNVSAVSIHITDIRAK